MTRRRILIACLAIAGALAWWYFTRPRNITVCVFTDPAFRSRDGWNGILRMRIEAVSRIYARQVGIRWKAVDLTQPDPTGDLHGLDARRGFWRRGPIARRICCS